MTRTDEITSDVPWEIADNPWVKDAVAELRRLDMALRDVAFVAQTKIAMKSRAKDAVFGGKNA